MCLVTVAGTEWLVVAFAIAIGAVPALIIFWIAKKVINNDRQIRALQKELNDIKNKDN